jgi:hypothetical protein
MQPTIAVDLAKNVFERHRSCRLRCRDPPLPLGAALRLLSRHHTARKLKAAWRVPATTRPTTDCFESNETMANRSDRGGIEPITSVAYPGPVSAIGSPPAHSILARSFKPPLKGRRYDCAMTS